MIEPNGELPLVIRGEATTPEVEAAIQLIMQMARVLPASTTMGLWRWRWG
jgi:hypothetical protein